ncbi:MAG: phytanoyl-CoA dioxygenase family protein [Pyrinomonadaceae bacterium]
MNKFWTLRRFVKNIDPVWRFYSNFSPTLRYMISGNGRLDSTQSEILRELDENGIVITTVSELFGDTSQFEELDSEVSRVLQLRKDEIEELRSMANDDTAIGSKTFILEVLGSDVVFDERSIFARIALNNSLLNIADSYLRMTSKLRYYNVWQTFASSGAARESQLWHFDREDRLILKVFLYLNDVDEGAGPFTYAPGTHKKGRYRAIEPESFVEGGVRRTTDEQMSEVFAEDKWIKGIGKKGTLILADTRGFHKGGESRTKDRLMYTCMYTSPASESRNLVSFSDDFDKNSLDRRQLGALGIK